MNGWLAVATVGSSEHQYEPQPTRFATFVAFTAFTGFTAFTSVGVS
jgi:hypothetical protein